MATARRQSSANAQNADFLGQGVGTGAARPDDPNDLPNPANPGGLSNNEIRRRQNILRASGATGSAPTLGGSPEQIARARAAQRAGVVTANAPNNVLGDIGTIWGSDPVTTGVLAAPYGIAAAGALIPAAVGGVGGAAAIPGTAATTGAATTAAAQTAAAQAALAGGTGAAAAPAAAVPAAAAGGGLARSLIRGGSAILGGASALYGATRGGGGGGSGGSATAAAPVTPTTYGPSGGYLQPTVTPPGGAQNVRSLADSFSAAQAQGIAQNNPYNAAGANSIRSQATPIRPPPADPRYQQFQTLPQQQSTQSGVQSVQNLANTFASQNTAASQGYAQTAAAAANRQAPQIAAPSSAQMQGVYNAAASFQPNTSGIAGIRAATADTSGAGLLENYQTDQAGIQNLDAFQSTNTAQGVNALYGFRPENTQAGLGNVEGFYASETNQAAQGLNQFQSTEALKAAEGLRGFGAMNGGEAAGFLLDYSKTGGQSATGAATQLGNFQSDRSGIAALQGFAGDAANRANEAQGPSQAQALLRAQSDADKRTALAIARSGRGTPASIAAAQRQAISEGAAIAGETRGQAAALSAQEFDTYKQRQLTADSQRLGALAQAGSLISQAEAQRLQGLQASGALLNQQDQLKLSSLQAFAQVQSARDAQMLSAQQSAGQLSLGADTNRLSGMQSAGQLRAAGDQMRLSGMQSGLSARSAMDAQLLGATSNAAQLQSNMDAQRLGALQTSGQIRAQNDATRMSGLQTAGNIRLQGSEINQRGQIEATRSELAGSDQQLRALGLQGQIASDIRSQDINVLRSNLDASMQQMNLNDTQIRSMAELGARRDIASQNILSSAAQFGVSAQQAQQALDLQYQQTQYSQLSQQQQLEYNYNALNANTSLGLGSQAISIAGQQQQQNQFNAQQSQADRDFWLRFGSTALNAASQF